MGLLKSRNNSFMWRRSHRLKNILVFFSLVPLMLVCLYVWLYGGDAPVVFLHDAHPSTFDAPAYSISNSTQNYTQLSFNMPYESAWRQHAHLVVFSVMATDKPERQELRNNQRSTWLRYPDVAKRSNAFEGLMLPLYITAPSGTDAVHCTRAMADEMDTHHDVLMLRVREVPDLLDPEGNIVLARRASDLRKQYLFFMYAYNAFPEAPFIAQGDDSTYVYVPEYLRMLRQLPRIKTIYGSIRARSWMEHETYPKQWAEGVGSTVTRDIAAGSLQDAFVQQYVVSHPFSYRHVHSDADEVMYRYGDVSLAKTIERIYAANEEDSGDTTTNSNTNNDNNKTLMLRDVRPDSRPREDDPRLPAVEGWGKAYMAYVRDPQHVPHTGRAVSSDGRYNMTYSFQPPSTMRRGNNNNNNNNNHYSDADEDKVLWVNDNCRMRSQRAPRTKARMLVSKDSLKAEEYQLHWEYNNVFGEDFNMPRPQHVQVLWFKLQFYKVVFSGIETC